MRLSLARKLTYGAVVVTLVGGGLLPLAGAWRRARIDAAFRPSYGVGEPGLAKEWTAEPAGAAKSSDAATSVPPPPPRRDPQTAGSEPPWRRTGDPCQWLATRAGAAYPFDVCLAREYVKDRVEIHDGIWGPRIPVPKAANELRIGCFGGSTVEGFVNLPTQQSWPDRLQRQLARRRGAKGNVRVINFGIAGARSAVARWRLEHETADLDLDAVVLYVGENDVFQCNLFPDPETAALSHFVFSGDPADLARAHPWLSAELPTWRELRQRHRADLDELVARRGLPPAPREDQRWFSYLTHEIYAERRAAAYAGRYTRLDPETIRTSALGAVPPDLVEESDLGKNLGAMVESAQARGIAVVVAIPPVETSCRGFSPFACLGLPFRGEDLAAYLTGSIPAWLRTLAARYGVPLVDVQGALASDDRRCDDFVDVVHLSERGMDSVASLIAPAVETALAKRSPVTAGVARPH